MHRGDHSTSQKCGGSRIDTSVLNCRSAHYYGTRKIINFFNIHQTCDQSVYIALPLVSPEPSSVTKITTVLCFEVLGKLFPQDMAYERVQPVGLISLTFN